MNFLRNCLDFFWNFFGIFYEILRVFFGRIVLEKFVGRIFWEDFLGGFLEGFFWDPRDPKKQW